MKKSKLFIIIAAIAACIILGGIILIVHSCGNNGSNAWNSDDGYDDGNDDNGNYDEDGNYIGDGSYNDEVYDFTVGDYGENDAKNNGYALKMQMIDERNAVIMLTDESLSKGLPMYDSSIEDYNSIKSYSICLQTDRLGEHEGINMNIYLPVQNNQYLATENNIKTQLPGEYNDASFNVSVGGYNGIDLYFPNPEVYVEGNNIFFVCAIPEESEVTFESVWNCKLFINYNGDQGSCYSDYYIETLITDETLLNDDIITADDNIGITMSVSSEKKVEFTLTYKKLAEDIAQGLDVSFNIDTPWFNGRLDSWGDEYIPEKRTWSFCLDDYGLSYQAVYNNDGSITFTVYETYYSASEDWDFTENSGTVAISVENNSYGNKNYVYDVAQIKTGGTNGLYSSASLALATESDNYIYVNEFEGYSESELDSIFFFGSDSSNSVMYKKSDVRDAYLAGTGRITYTRETYYYLTISNNSLSVCNIKYVYSSIEGMLCEYSEKNMRLLFNSTDDYDAIVYTKAATDSGKAIVYLQAHGKTYYSGMPSVYCSDGDNYNTLLAEAMSQYGAEKTKVKGTWCGPFAYASDSSEELISYVNVYASDSLSFRPDTEDYIITESYGIEGALVSYDEAHLYSYTSGKTAQMQVREVYATASAALERYIELTDARLAGNIVYHTLKTDISTKEEVLATAADGRFASAPGAQTSETYTYKRTVCTADYSSIGVTISQPAQNRLTIVFNNLFAKDTYYLNRSTSYDGFTELDVSFSVGDWDSAEYIRVSSSWYKQYDMASSQYLTFAELNKELRLGSEDYNNYSSGRYVTAYSSDGKQVWDIVFPEGFSLDVSSLIGKELGCNYRNGYGVSFYYNTIIDESIISDYAGSGDTGTAGETGGTGDLKVLADDVYTANIGEYVYIAEYDTEVEVQAPFIDVNGGCIYDETNYIVGVFEYEDGYVLRLRGAGMDADFELKTMTKYYNSSIIYGTSDTAVIDGITYNKCRASIRVDDYYLYYTFYDQNNVILEKYFYCEKSNRMIKVGENGLGKYKEDDGSTLNLYLDKYGILTADIVMADGYSTSLWGFKSAKSTDTSIYYDSYDENGNELRGHIYINIDDEYNIYTAFDVELNYGDLSVAGYFEYINIYTAPDTYDNLDSAGTWGPIPTEGAESIHFQPETDDYIVTYDDEDYIYMGEAADTQFLYFQLYVLYSYDEYGRKVNTKKMYVCVNEAEAIQVEAELTNNPRYYYSLNDSEQITREGKYIYQYETKVGPDEEYYSYSKYYAQNDKYAFINTAIGFFFDRHYISNSYTTYWMSKPLSAEEGIKLLEKYNEDYYSHAGWYYPADNYGSVNISLGNFLSADVQFTVVGESYDLPIRTNRNMISDDGTLISIGTVNDYYYVAEIEFSDNDSITYTYYKYDQMPTFDTYKSMTVLEEKTMGPFIKYQW